MISSQSAASFSASDVFRKNSNAISKPRLSLLLSMPTTKVSKTSTFSSRKPLYISSTEGFGSFENSNPKNANFECKPYEDDRSHPLEANIELRDQQTRSASTQEAKISIYFATWWALNVVFNIYNKKVLNAFLYPWLTSLLPLVAGSLMMLISWATRIAEPPETDIQFWKTLTAATVSMSKVAVSFTHIIKSGEPALSVLVSRFIMGEMFPMPVYLSLLPIIGGCGLAALTELNFNMFGFMGAMISNLAFVFRNIFSKKGMGTVSV